MKKGIALLVLFFISLKSMSAYSIADDTLENIKDDILLSIAQGDRTSYLETLNNLEDFAGLTDREKADLVLDLLAAPGVQTPPIILDFSNGLAAALNIPAVETGNVFTTLYADTITENTTGHGTTINSVTIKSGALNNLAITSGTFGGVPYVSATPTTVDTGLILRPTGFGYISALIPDGTPTGGNARGIKAVDFQTVLNDATNVASGNNSVIVGGTTNTASGASSFVGGGDANLASGNNSAVVGGGSNTITGFNSFVGGGLSNTVNGRIAFIGAGVSNSITGSKSFVGGGESNTVSGTLSGVCGGQSNTTSGVWSTIVGGLGNTNAQGNSFIGGGNNNQLTGSAFGDSCIVGGLNNSIASANFATIGGGSANSISANASNAVICGGGTNTATGQFSVILGGFSNTASGDFSVVAGRKAIASATATGAFVFTDDTDATYTGTSPNAMYLRFANGVSINTTTPSTSCALDVAGIVHATSFPTSSDARLKKEVHYFTGEDGILDKVMHLKPCTFEWNDRHPASHKFEEGQKQIGFIAQDVEQYFPELLTYWIIDHKSAAMLKDPTLNPDDLEDEVITDYRALDYARITSLLCRALQELKMQFDGTTLEFKDALAVLREEVELLKQQRAQA